MRSIPTFLSSLTWDFLTFFSSAVSPFRLTGAPLIISPSSPACSFSNSCNCFLVSPLGWIDSLGIPSFFVSSILLDFFQGSSITLGWLYRFEYVPENNNEDKIFRHTIDQCFMLLLNRERSVWISGNENGLTWISGAASHPNIRQANIFPVTLQPGLLNHNLHQNWFT